jgi:O-antigen ligase
VTTTVTATATATGPSPIRRRRRRRDPNLPRRAIRVAFTLFILSMPIESAKFAGMPENLTFAKIFGYLFLLLALLQPRVVFRRPRVTVVCFWLYGLAAALLVAARPAPGAVSYLLQLLQWLTLLWAASNLLTHASVRRSALLALYGGCVILAAMQASGGLVEWGVDRAGVLTENPNTVGALLAIAIVAGVGWLREYSRGSASVRILLIGAMGLLAVQLVRTQSRGAMLALGLGALTYALTAQRLTGKLKMAVVVSIVIATVGTIVLQSELARERWTVVLQERNLGGREYIYPAAWKMITEQPLIGWGPVRHFYELGSRTGEETMEEHNLLLFVLAEGGVLTSVPYVIGLISAVMLALRARRRGVGIAALALLVTLATVNLSNVFHNRKVQWVLIAFAVGAAPVVRRRAGATHRVGPRVEAVRRPIQSPALGASRS